MFRVSISTYDYKGCRAFMPELFPVLHRLRSKKLREDTIVFWSRISSCLPSFIRDAVARLVHSAFDFIDYRLMCNVYLDTSMGVLPQDQPVVIAMSHPGLDERLLLQHISLRYCGGRRAIAASNLIDPNTKKQYSSDFMRFMGLHGVLSHRLKAIMESKSTSDTPLPGSANDAFFELMADVLERGDNVIFAPEGETNPWPSLKPFKSGIVRVAVRYANRTKRSISIVPVACHFIATGAWTRDAVVCIGPAVSVRPEDFARLGGSDSDSGDHSDSIRDYISKLTAQLRERMRDVHDSVPYGISATAPHHNGRSDLEKADPYLRTQLRFQDTLSNLVAAAFVLFRVRHFRDSFQNIDFGTMDAKSKAIWRCKAIQRLGCSLCSSELAIKTLGDSFASFESKLQSLIELVSRSDECPALVQTLPIDFCARRIELAGTGGPCLGRATSKAGNQSASSYIALADRDMQDIYIDLLSAAEDVYMKNTDFLSSIFSLIT